MRDVTRQLQDYWAEIASGLPEPSLEAALQVSVGEGDVRPIQWRRPRRCRPAWAIAAVAFGLALLFGVVAWLLLPYGGSRGFVDEGPDVTTIGTPVPTTTAQVTRDSILSTARAKTPPPAATCPEGTNPDAPGPVDQPRPNAGFWNNQSAVFDRHAGRIIHVDATGATWAFDVCTNTWQELGPAVIPAGSEGSTSLSGSAELVYDVDSDRTVAFGGEAVAVYDAAGNTWTVRPKPAEYRDTGSAGAVYDPVSGLIVLQAPERGVITYDVDTDTWTSVGSLTFCTMRMVYDPDADLWSPAEPEPCWPILVGYAASTDQLIFLGKDPWSRRDDSRLVSPRTGAAPPLQYPRGAFFPFGSVDEYYIGYWGRAQYAQDTTGTDTTTFMIGEQVCHLDAEAGSWTCADLPYDPAIDRCDGFSARVADPINQRIVLIDGYHWEGEDTALPEQHDYGVWAIDLDTGEWVQLVASQG